MKQVSCTFGRGSKNGPIHSKMHNKILQDTIEAICVFPPTVCWINDLDREAVTGIHEKNDPTRFPDP